MASLLILEGPAKGQQFALEQHRLVLIGRDHECTFQILDTQVSRRHFQLRLDPDENRHVAIDFESSNGVSINGEKIATQKPLKDGDSIRIGGTMMVYSTQDSPDAQHYSDMLRKIGEGRRDTQLDN